MDTAQPAAAAETDPVADAASAFKAFDAPAQPRDDSGKFASTEIEEELPPEEPYAEEAEPLEAEADDGDNEEDEQEAAEEAQPLPPSWGADDQDLWESLSPEAQGKIALREGERDRGLNLRLQETANARKAAQAKVVEVSNTLEHLSNVIGTVEGLYKTPEPDARAFGYGTEQFNEAAYRAAHQQWRETEGVLAQLKEQQSAAQKEVEEASNSAFSEWKQEHETQFAPKLLADVPELQDPARGQPVLDAMITYATENGIPAEVFSPESQEEITSAQLHILWKAQQYDRIRQGKTPPKPRSAGPAVKPGVSSPRSAQKATQRKRVFDRNAREGSIESGAAVFKQFLKG